jgi:hypothetical protein
MYVILTLCRSRSPSMVKPEACVRTTVVSQENSRSRINSLTGELKSQIITYVVESLTVTSSLNASLQTHTKLCFLNVTEWQW